MLDFRKKMRNRSEAKNLDPVSLYETLDRAHDKGPLRPIQEFVLTEWHEKARTKKDVLLKLHTGQGKTLVGLLALHSKRIERGGRCLYVCPNNYLRDQTIEQAKQFGIKATKIDVDIPDEFLNGHAIGVANVHKLFNGLSQFGIGRNNIELDAIVIDDAHACSDTIREIFRITISNSDSCYDGLIKLFSADLEKQGVGTFADILNAKSDSFLPVPYWTWISKESSIAEILSKATDKNHIKFVWPLIRDNIKDCLCVVSGKQIQIEPFFPRIDLISSYFNATHRIFMSATVSDDSFLIKGLQIKKSAILNPIQKKEDRWSGEKLVLIPSIIHEDLDRTDIVNFYGKPDDKRIYGIVALAPSFPKTLDWEGLGSFVCKTENVTAKIEALVKANYSETIVIVNRYDGIDLPDDSCRILILDRLPFADNLIDLYVESCRNESAEILMRHSRKIEQGAGRSVRGEKDYSVILVIGEDLTRVIKSEKTQKYLSEQMKKQIAIGMEVAQMAAKEVGSGSTPINVLTSVINQCLGRDEGWKEYYQEEMDSIEPNEVHSDLLTIFEMELNAAQCYEIGEIDKGNEIYQNIVDKYCNSDSEKAWYIQEIARQNFTVRRAYSEEMQMVAFKKNRALLKPHEGVTARKIKIIPKSRIEKIHSWIKQFGSYTELSICIADHLSAISFGVDSDKFEEALDAIGKSLGFDCERPDKEWKEGPDNLWALEDGKYIIWECKNEVNQLRSEIYKYEADQMNTSYAWFKRTYDNSTCKSRMIHPSQKLANSASFLCPVEILTEPSLRKFVNNVRHFFKEYENQSFASLSDSFTNQLLAAHELSIDDFWNKIMGKKPKIRK